MLLVHTFMVYPVLSYGGELLIFNFDSAFTNSYLANLKSLIVEDLYAVAFQIACMSSVWGSLLYVFQACKQNLYLLRMNGG